MKKHNPKLAETSTLKDLDKGQWIVVYDDRGEVLGVASEDLTFDVVMVVDGLFKNKDQKEDYCLLVCKTLNGG